MTTKAPICECANQDCSKPLPLTFEQYHAIMHLASSLRYIQLPGCPMEPGDTITETHEGYIVVQPGELETAD